MENMSPEEFVDISIKILSKIMESISERISEKMKGMDKNDPMGAMFVNSKGLYAHEIAQRALHPAGGQGGEGK